MLTQADRSECRYTIALNNASDGAEVMADCSYLEAAPNGVLTFDFTHMAAPLTQEKREEYLPGGFGYQPTLQLVEVVSAIIAYMERLALCPHRIVALFPSRNKSRVGSFLTRMGVPALLGELGINVRTVDPAQVEFGEDDRTRRNLIPLTAIHVSHNGPNFAVLTRTRERIEQVFAKALPGADGLAGCFTAVVNEAVDNLIEYGHGGIIGGLYYPKVGEVEITLVNRDGGFGGSTPAEQLDALVSACEGKTSRPGGGGNGIQELSHLAMTCFGSLLLRNGNATLRLPPDGSVVGTTTDSGLPTPGASVTILLQLLPDSSVTRTEAMKAFEEVLKRSLNLNTTPEMVAR